MTTHEAGFESSILDDIRAGRKTVEGRLAINKFLNFQPGDRINMREDFYQGGVIVRSNPGAASAIVQKVERYKGFEAMLKASGLEAVLPRAKTLRNGIAEYRKFYSSDDENTYGVMAIHFKLIQ